MKVDREAVATLVLPQLWAMSMGPLLTVSQFKRFMEVIRKLGDRVEREHDQYLRDSQRIEDRSATAVNGATGTSTMNGAVDFESLVTSGGVVATVKADTVIDSSKDWEDDVWGSIFTSDPVTPAMQSPAASPPTVSPPPIMPLQPHTQSLPSSPRLSTSRTNSSRGTVNRSSRGLGATPIPSTSFNAFTPTYNSPSIPTQSIPSGSISSPMMPQMQSVLSATTPPSHVQTPNYNISLTATPPLTSMSTPPLFASPPVMSSPLVPSKPSQPAWPSNGAPKQLTKDDWGDFDPLA